MGKIRVFTVILLACNTLVSVCHADSIDFVILGPSGLADCTFSSGSGVYQVFATLNLSAPAKALELSVPNWCEFGSGISWSYPTYGDPSSLTVDFGGCITGSVTLYSAVFFLDRCCPSLLNGPITTLPSPESPPILIGCDDKPRFLIPPCSASFPSLLTPADGATGVAVRPFMSWDYEFGNYCLDGIGIPTFRIFYGTDPENLDQSADASDNHRWTLPLLEPYTQYFWRVRVVDDYAWYTGSYVNFSEIRSFTTGGTNPVERITWGAVKAIYQE